MREEQRIVLAPLKIVEAGEAAAIAEAQRAIEADGCSVVCDHVQVDGRTVGEGGGVGEQQMYQARAGLDYESSFGKAAPNDLLLKLRRTTLYYKRNLAHICSFFVRRKVNDPVAKKMMRLAEKIPSLEASEDTSIKTLFVGGVDSRITEANLKNKFYSYGEIESICLITPRSCAFITFTRREDAEKAAEGLANKLIVKGIRLKLDWGNPLPSPLPLVCMASQGRVLCVWLWKEGEETGCWKGERREGGGAGGAGEGDKGALVRGRKGEREETEEDRVVLLGGVVRERVRLGAASGCCLRLRQVRW
ncbi:unnamed protein product [Closterium sp. Naga37s-1]|nr:unnamed protein product [Closterium sp. Naga37s-1]